jgi:hypothetical protein
MKYEISRTEEGWYLLVLSYGEATVSRYSTPSIELFIKRLIETIDQRSAQIDEDCDDATIAGHLDDLAHLAAMTAAFIRSAE